MAKFTKPNPMQYKPQLTGGTDIQTKHGNVNPYGRTNPLNNPANELALLNHIKARLDSCNSARGNLVNRCADIDRQVSGFIKLDREDQKRDADNKAGKAPKPVKHNLPLVQAQLAEAVTFLATVFAPDGNIFEAVAPPEEAEVAKAFSKYTNDNGQRVGYYTQLVKFLTNAMRYNLGALTTNWEEQTGTLIGNDVSGQPKLETNVVWAGNILKSVDIYNFLWDTAVHPTNLAMYGEWFAEVEMTTPFRIRKMEQDKQLFYADRYVQESAGQGTRYYCGKPDLRDGWGNQGVGTDWKTFWGGAGELTDTIPGIELVFWTGWIVPKTFGLGDSKDYELWRITVANGQYITATVKLEAASGMLPIGVATPIIDDLDNQQRTYSEQLLPLQHFSSFLLNTHQDATRKSLYGVKIYNQSVLGNLDRAFDDLVSAWIPTRSTAVDVDLNKAVRFMNDAPDTANNVTDIGRIEALMQKILPTDMLTNITSLDRATQFQAAAAVQASNRRALTIARLIYSMALMHVKTQMIYNVYMKQPQIEVYDEKGEVLKIDPASLREMRIEYEIAGGLKGLDRLSLMTIMNQIIMMVMQSQQAMAELDVVAMITYYMSLAGDNTNLSFFKRKEPAPATPGQAMPGQSPVTPGGGEQAPVFPPQAAQ